MTCFYKIQDIENPPTNQGDYYDRMDSINPLYDEKEEEN